MRLNLRTLVLASAAFCSTAAFAANEVRVNVPFNFVVKNHTYQAGTYKVVVEPERSLVTLRKVEDPVQSGSWFVGPGDGEATPHKVCLTFDPIGENMALRSIQYGALTTPSLDAQSKHKAGETKIVGE
jgi:hypothetical protein